MKYRENQLTRLLYIREKSETDIQALTDRWRSTDREKHEQSKTYAYTYRWDDVQRKAVGWTERQTKRMMQTDGWNGSQTDWCSRSAGHKQRVLCRLINVLILTEKKVHMNM